MPNKDHGANLPAPMHALDFLKRNAHWILAWPAMTFLLCIAAPYVGGQDHNGHSYGTVALLVASNLLGMSAAARQAWCKYRSDKIRKTFQVALDAGQEGYFLLRAIYNEQNQIVDFVFDECNEYAAHLIGKTRMDILSSRLSSIFSGEKYISLFHSLTNAMNQETIDGHAQVQPDSPINAEWIYRRAVRTGDSLAITVRDVSEQKAHEEKLETLENFDPLTGLPNRHWLLMHLQNVLATADRTGRTVGLMLIDLDNFHHINSSLGHDTGDRLLAAAAARLRKITRASEHVVHLSGDEFAILIEAAGTKETAAPLIDRITASFAEALFLEGQVSHHVDLSLGMSFYPQDASSADILVKNAGIAMYAAKDAGKARHAFYEPELSERLNRRALVENSLRRAIELDEFVLYYQPRVNATSGQIVSMEALLRWVDQAGHVVLPEQFIPLAEETGLIRPLGDLVIQKACAQISQWQKEGLPIVPVSVNVSAPQLSHGGIARFIQDTLESNAVAPELLEVEITESCMVTGAEVAHTQIHCLEKLGVKLLIDDFGTGYSSLSQLRQLDLDVLKIDRSFIKELGTDPQANVLFESIVGMAHALGMTTVAEGVETAAQAALLQKYHCDEVQGYYVSRPVPAADIPPLLRKQFLYPACNDEAPSLLIA